MAFCLPYQNIHEVYKHFVDVSYYTILLFSFEWNLIDIKLYITLR